jgi:hypothetical protein
LGSIEANGDRLSGWNLFSPVFSRQGVAGEAVVEKNSTDLGSPRSGVDEVGAIKALAPIRKILPG